MIEIFLAQAAPRTFNILVSAKDDENGNILTLDAFSEMLELNRMIYEDLMLFREEIVSDSGEVFIEGGEPAYFPDICMNTLNDDGGQVDQQCVTSAKPFDFIYNPITDSYDLG